MMKLFGNPGACSMSGHIAFEEAKLNFEAVMGDWDSVEKYNPQGAVGVLLLEDGQVITQNIAIMTYAANTPTGAHLLPKPGTIDYVKAYQWLSWVASDLHPSFVPLFNDDTPEAERKKAETHLHKLLAISEKHLTGKNYLVDNQYTAADGYFFTVFNWTKSLEIPTDQYKVTHAYLNRIAERPAVQAVLKREKLI